MKQSNSKTTPHDVNFLMHIAFDNTRRLVRNHYCFEYRGIQFKLVQNNPRKWADQLLTIIPMNDEAAQEKAFSVAAEFLSALGWENNSTVSLWFSGGAGLQTPSLRSSKPIVYTFPRVAYEGLTRGYDLVTIPHIKNDSQRIALALFREANASNNDYLSFLLFWQVLEVDGTEPIGFVNRTYRKASSKLGLDSETMRTLPLGGRSLGYYLYDDCRNAIGHIRRKPGKTSLDVDRSSERLRLARSVTVIKKFAEYYICEHLDLKERLFLCSRSRREIPRYMDSAARANSSYKFIHRAEVYLPRNLFRREFIYQRCTNPAVKSVIILLVFLLFGALTAFAAVGAEPPAPKFLKARVEVEVKNGIYSYRIHNDEPVQSVYIFHLDIKNARITVVGSPPGWGSETNGKTFVAWLTGDEALTVPRGRSLGGPNTKSGSKLYVHALCRGRLGSHRP
jgi:hypothetical protein